MPTSVHQLDDGAWISVDDTRRVSVSQLWLLAEGFCGCEVTDFLAEGFVEVGVDPPRDVQARIAGQCIQCGESGVTDWLTVGRAHPEDGFRPVVVESVHLPGRRTRS